MEEDSVSSGAQIKVICVSPSLCVTALGLSVIIRTMGTTLLVLTKAYCEEGLGGVRGCWGWILCLFSTLAQPLPLQVLEASRHPCLQAPKVPPDPTLTSALFSISHLCSIFMAKICPLSLCLTTAT